MIAILDASTLINLANGEVFADIVCLLNHRFLISETVRSESRSVVRAIQAAVDGGHIDWVDENLITASQFVAAKDAWGLDSGETECILAAEILGCAVACDDGAARKIIKQRLGESRLIGSVGLLRAAIAANLISNEVAFRAFELMKRRGGYLPHLTLDDFTSVR